MLIDGQSGDSRQDDGFFPAIRAQLKFPFHRMRGYAGIGLVGIEIDGPNDRHHHQDHHHGEYDPGVFQLAEHSAIHQDQRHRKQHHRDAFQKVGQRGRILEGMGGVCTVEAAAVGTELLHRDEGRQGAQDNGLLFGLATIGTAHCRGFDRGDELCRLEGHRHSLLQAHQRK